MLNFIYIIQTHEETLCINISENIAEYIRNIMRVSNEVSPLVYLTCNEMFDLSLFFLIIVGSNFHIFRVILK